MKRSRSVAVVSSVVVAAVVAAAFAEPPRTEAARTGEPPFVGQRVKIYFKQSDKLAMKEIPGATLFSLTGTITQADAAYVTLVSPGNDTFWIPVNSIGYIQSEASPATAPATPPG